MFSEELDRKVNLVKYLRLWCRMSTSVLRFLLANIVYKMWTKPRGQNRKEEIVILSPMGYVVATIFVLYEEWSLTYTECCKSAFTGSANATGPYEGFVTPEVYAVTNMTFSASKPHPHLPNSIFPGWAQLPIFNRWYHQLPLCGYSSLISYPPTSQENEPEAYVPP
jgi:hypothetical protein